MDDTMRTAFARQGYIVVPDVLNQQERDELNAVYDQPVLAREAEVSTVVEGVLMGSGSSASVMGESGVVGA